MKKNEVIIAGLALLCMSSMSKAGDIKVNFDGAGVNMAADTAGQAFKPLTLKLPAAAASCKAGTVTDTDQVPCPKPESVEPKQKKTVEEKSVNEILSGLNPQQRLVFFESITFNKEGKVASFYTKDIKEALGEKALIDVLKKFGIDVGTTRGGLRAVDEKWCVSAGSCGYNKDYACTDNC